MKNYGLKLQPKATDHYVFGAYMSLPKVVLQPDGQWDKYLPTYEIQNEKYETWGCTVWGTQNAFEILFKRLFKKEVNADERFNYNCVGITPPGSDPHLVAESLRKDGLTFGFLSIPSTFEEFKTPRPMSDTYIWEGKKWTNKYRFTHEWVSTDAISLKEALKYSPLCISVTAWEQDADGLYIDRGLPNTHWTVCYGYTEKDGKIYLKIFDSYNHTLKILHPAHHIEVAKRYHLENIEAERLSIWKWLMKQISLFKYFNGK